MSNEHSAEETYKLLYEREKERNNNLMTRINSLEATIVSEIKSGYVHIMNNLLHLQLEERGKLIERVTDLEGAIRDRFECNDHYGMERVSTERKEDSAVMDALIRLLEYLDLDLK